MPREATPLDRWEPAMDPENPPEGLEVAQTSRTIGTRPDKPEREEGETKEAYAERFKALCDADPDYVQNHPLSVWRVARVDGAPNGETLHRAIEALSEHGPGDDFGIKFVANAIDAALLDHVSKLTVETMDDSLSFVPPASGPRYVDPYEAAQAVISSIYESTGRMPSLSRMREIYDDFDIDIDEG